MTDFISYVIRGTPFGCVFALMAIGLVLTYKTSGVFNLAFGAQAYVSAAVYYDTRVTHHWPILTAFLLSVVVIGPVVGVLLDRGIFRFQRTAPPIARLVSSLGLLVAVPQIVNLWFGSSPHYGPVGIWPSSQEGHFAIYHFGRYALSGDEVATLVSTVVVVIALTALFRYSAIGLRMRAVVESPRMTELSGINADRVGTFAWVLSSLLAGLAGVLLAPLFAQVNAQNFTTLIVAAIAAAAFGRLASVPLTLLGGILLGASQGILGGYLPTNSILARGLRPSLPFALLFLLLLFWPGLRRRREAADPLIGVEPPPPAAAAAARSRELTIATRTVAVVSAAVAISLAMSRSYWLKFDWLGGGAQILIFAIIFLSVTVITGMAGQLSLCQATFAGIGAFTTAQLVHAFGLSVLLAVVAGAVLAAIVGGLLAIPALRLGGIYLALATFAFALMFESVLLPLGWVSGGIRMPRVPRPVIGPVDFASDRPFFFLCAAVLVVAGVLVILVRRGTTGRYLEALRGSETAAQAIGINPARAKITAFALSAGLAGLGGGLLATQKGVASPGDYASFLSLLWVVLVVTLGSRNVQGAFFAAFGIALTPFIFQWIFDQLPFLADWFKSPDNLAVMLFGLGAITYAKHPEGIMEFQTRQSIAFVQRQIDKLKPEPSPGPPAGEALAVAAPERVSSAEVGVDQ